MVDKIRHCGISQNSLSINNSTVAAVISQSMCKVATQVMNEDLKPTGLGGKKVNVGFKLKLSKFKIELFSFFFLLSA